MQPTPYVSHSDVERVVHREYSGELYAQVMAALNQYTTLANWKTETHRIQLAALKLAAGDFERLSGLLSSADPRDLMAAAEYPDHMKHGQKGRLTAEEQQRMIDQDWAQYSEWLYRQ